MSFNLDDPLAGILSDGSDDSFFDDDILGKKKPTPKKANPSADKKSALFDLGDGDKAKVSQDKTEALFETPEYKKPSVAEDKGLINDVPKSGSFKRTLSKEAIKMPEPKSIPSQEKVDFSKSPARPKHGSSAEKLNILDSRDTRKDPPKPMERGKSSQSLLDDILGGSSTKTTGANSKITRPGPVTKSQDFDLDSILGKSESKLNVSGPKTNTPKSVTKTTPKPEISNKKPNDDWLGIFGDKDETGGDEDGTDMPAWLVGDTKKKKPTESKKDPNNPPKDTLEVQVKEQEETKPETVFNIEQTINPNLIVNPTIPIVNSNEDLTAEGAALYMQQQESQLMVALQLKAQEEKLAAMHTRQKDVQRVQREAALAQHGQVESMLRRQADQRQQMQSIIAAHQERITQRIKALLGTANAETDNEVHEGDEYEATSTDKRDSPHVKEKKQLLQLVQSLQENHDKEIDLMETSYRRQLAFLEISLSHSEERMKEESDKLVKFYSEKIGWLEEHHQLYKKMTEDNLSNLSERHKTENELLRQQHLENIKVLQEHHAALIENIKNAVKQEQVLIQDSAGFSSDLHRLVIDVKDNKNQFQELVDKVEKLAASTHRESERSLQSREILITDMMQQIKKERENFETEKFETRDMVKMLETRLKQMTAMVEDETSALKQKRMEFEFEKATFNKQTEFAKNILKKQDDEIKMLKDDIQKEYQDKIAKIDEEKAKAIKDSAAIAKEKTSIQNLKQELDKTKAELEAQLEELTEERSKLNMEKQRMHMEEQRILAKSRDLDLLAKTAIEKQTQSDKKYSEAEFIQRKYEDRIRRMQEHVVSLNSREKQIAREKVALSRERLMLHNERKQIESRQPCSLCKSVQQTTYNFDSDPKYALPDAFLNVPVSRDYDRGNVNTAMNAIEQEMAHLIGRNFSLRHTTGIVTDQRLLDDRTSMDYQNPEIPQGESGAFKDYMDPKFMMLRLDVQQVLSNLDSKKNDKDHVEENDE